ncbi:MAG TPA: hypothetical protein VFA04_27665 [Bryobacteraceae bacterium]|nr:hypothetical protein [Bryobacteraceae bacterium]
MSNWAGIAVGLLIVAVWFVRSAWPYQTAEIRDSSAAKFRILHVQKHGLQFDETLVTAARDTRAWTSRTRSHLFQYQFAHAIRQSIIPREDLTAFLRSANAWRLQIPAAHSLWSWNAEGWYVVLDDQRLLTFTTESRSAPPPPVTKIFNEIEALPSDPVGSFFLRDICFGFCYDPIAALGFTDLRGRDKLLGSKRYAH